MNNDSSSLSILRHDAAHVLAMAVQELFPGTQVTIGPVIEDGFFYDFSREKAFIPEDLEKIEKRMKELVAADTPIVRSEISREEAIKKFSDMGETFKIEIIESIASNEPITLYSQGNWADLCGGPHVESTKKIKAFKLLHTSSAYWRGDERNPVLQRIYGTAWNTEKELRLYLKRLEEAKKRDHRKLGKELDLFSVSDEIGPGLILWHPKGARIRHLMEEFWKKEHFKHGYETVSYTHLTLPTSDLV